MATASANAAERSIGTRIFWADSGFLPIDSIALAPIFPMAKAGPIEPTPMAIALANIVRSIMFGLLAIDRFTIFNVVAVRKINNY